MAALREYVKKFKQINLQTAVVEAVNQSKSEIVSMQAQQYGRGEMRDGNSFPNYSRRSVEEFGKPPGPWRLFDTGEFYAKLQVSNVSKDGWQISSDSTKTSLILGQLEMRGGNKSLNELFGLSAETLDAEKLASKILLPKIKEITQNQTGLKW
jgi:hypothetical protein